MEESRNSKREYWRNSLQEVINKIWVDPPLPEHLYHYTSLDGARGILSSREIWLSDILSMKDVDDGKYWIEVFRSVLNRKSVPQHVKKPFQKGSSFGLGTHWYSYVACFSPEPALEYQWEHYADQGRGCAIEISLEALIDRCDSGRSYAWAPMLYDPHEQIVMAERTIDAAIAMYRRESLTAEEVRDYWTYGAFSFLLSGTRFKRPSFFQEREWRVFISRPGLEQAKYRDNGRIRYLSLPLTPDMITGVVKGPACSCPDSELANLLSGGGYRTTIRNAALAVNPPI